MSTRWLFSYLSPKGARARLTVFIFHRVLPAIDPLFPGEVDVERFENQVAWIKSWFNVLPLDEAVDRLRATSLPARAAAITFDDGYADNCTLAMPILRRAGVSATFFIATGYLDGGRMWNDTVIDAVRQVDAPSLDLAALDLGTFPTDSIEARRNSVGKLLGKLKYLEPQHRERLANEITAISNTQPPNDLMLTTQQVRALADAQMGIGAHTVSHPILACVEDQEARNQMTESKARLESIIGNPVRLFAYPNGKPDTDYKATHVRLAREAGFTAAVSTQPGVATLQSDLFQIPRFAPWDYTRWRYGMRLARNLMHPA